MALDDALTAHSLITQIFDVLALNPPQGLSTGYIRGFQQRMGGVLEQRLAAALVRFRIGGPQVAPQWDEQVPPELWKPAARTQANLEAMRLLASKPLQQLTDEDRKRIALYSGWGGLSLERVQSQFPAGFPIPDERGLIHEYYTPSSIANEVARILGGVWQNLPKDSSGRVKALEPSAGIGRFIRAIEVLGRGRQVGPAVDWTAIELSEVSARLLSALYPSLKLHTMPFERWIAQKWASERGTFGLVVANPPYGPRGTFATEDGDSRYRVRQAYLYFLLRALEMLAKNGVAVFLIPAGFMSSGRSRAYREFILRSHHLLTAYRLPSQSERTRDPIFPGANLVTDLLFFQSRGAPLKTVLPDDLYIVEGEFFRRNGSLILGREYDGDDDDDHTARPRFRYAVIGEFTGIPSWSPRPMQEGELLEPTETRAQKHRGTVVRDLREQDDLSPALTAAMHLGVRLDRYFVALSRGDHASAASSHPELKTALESWVKAYGNPYSHTQLQGLIAEHQAAAERFLTGFTRQGVLIASLQDAPKFEAVYQGEDNLMSRADWLYRKQGTLELSQLVAPNADVTEREEALATLVRAGWCIDYENDRSLVPSSIYYTGFLWPKVDACSAHAETHAQAADQHAKLMAIIKPSLIEDIIDDIRPRDSWLPVEVLEAWMIYFCQKHLNRSVTNLELVREDGILRKEGVTYRAMRISESPMAEFGWPDALLDFLGYANHDMGMFRPKRLGTPPDQETFDEARLRVAHEYTLSFQGWLRTRTTQIALVIDTYNRVMRGFVPAEYSGEPISIERWSPTAPKLYEYQWRGARRVLANRCGLLAFDVGLGKTYTGLSILARARQEGWARRPVIVVPNSIVWKWYRDFKRCLPDYNVQVIGSKRKVIQTGERKGRVLAEPDSNIERAQKWTDFQAGLIDVVLLTYSAMPRTRIDREVLNSFITDVSAIQRQITLTVARAREKANDDEAKARKQPTADRKKTERKRVTEAEVTEGWLADRLEATLGQEYDPGIEWHSLGVDFLMVDESQNFKNLFMPEEREGGIPDAMGGTEESKRAWQLNFRAASTRIHTGGTGVILLSATPAKNGPVEFYNALHLINPASWERVGIDNPESYIDKFCGFEPRTAVTPEGRMVTRLACTSFKNLDVLRDVVFRYAEFQTAEDVGLKIPDAQNFEHFVSLDQEQTELLYSVWQSIRDIREKMKKMPKEAKAQREALRLKIMGLANRIDLIAIHPQLPASEPEESASLPAAKKSLSGAQNQSPESNEQSFQREKAKVVRRSREEILAIPPHSGKIDAVAEQILTTQDTVCAKEDPEWCLSCGHIVFVENIAVHFWMRAVLVEAGIPERRIAILNAEVAKDPETRQQLAENFNGVGKPGDDVHVPPMYDIIIANSVAYEGIDLQRRTCEIHHIDLPWDPATLQQRNGRGVRQGNLFERVKIHYYLGKPSGDARRLSLITKKRSWMASLVKGQGRVTNNPAANVDMSVEDMLLEIVPAAEREAVLSERLAQERQDETNRISRVRIAANKVLKQANARYRAAERNQDAAESGRLRGEAEVIMQDLSRVESTDWPWMEFASKVREVPLWVPESGPPLWPGMYINLNGITQIGKTRTSWTEGATEGLGVRASDSIRWKFTENVRVEHRVAGLPINKLNLAPIHEGTLENAIEEVEVALVEGWSALGWHLAPDAWLEEWWPRLGNAIASALLPSYSSHQIPMDLGGNLRVYTQAQPLRRGAFRWEQVIPPTQEGWKRFLALGPGSGLAFTALDSAAMYWWQRRIPQNLLSAARRAQAGAADQPGVQLAALRSPDWRPRYTHPPRGNHV